MAQKIYNKAISGLVEFVMPALLKSIPKKAERNKVTLEHHDMRLKNIEEIQLKQSELNENVLHELRRKQRLINILYLLVILILAGLIVSVFV